MKISIIGSGYVGLVTGACFAKLNNEVICVDIDKDKVEKINRGISPFYEKGLDVLLKDVKDRLKATTDIKNAVINSDVTFICVGTPRGLVGEADLSYIESACKDIGEALKRKDEYHLVVVKSTVPPGTTEHRIKPLLEEVSKKETYKDFGLAMNPEFLREGNAIEDFMNPDRIVIGVKDDRSKEILLELYKDFNCPKLIVSPTTAEMIKYASNAFLAIKISFINEIGNLCKALGIDVYEVAKGIGLDKRIGKHFLRAGIGFGGSCFPKDVKALINKAREHFYHPIILNAALEINEAQPYKLVDLLEKKAGNLRGKDVTVLGLAFKPNTDDVREAPSIKIVNALLNKGAKVHVYDPKAMENFKRLFGNKIDYCNSAREAVSKSKYVLIVTEWNEFKDKELYKEKYVFDGRRVDEAKELAKYYEGVCW